MLLKVIHPGSNMGIWTTRAGRTILADPEDNGKIVEEDVVGRKGARGWSSRRMRV